PGPLTIDAVAVCGPASIVPPKAFTVIVNVWFVPTMFVAVRSEERRVATARGTTQFLLALGLPAVPVVRGSVTPPTGMAEVADTTVVPATADVIVTVHDAVAAPPVYVHEAEPTKLPGPLTIDAVAVCGPASIVPPKAFTVIVNVWFVPTMFVAV